MIRATYRCFVPFFVACLQSCAHSQVQPAAAATVSPPATPAPPSQAPAAASAAPEPKLLAPIGEHDGQPVRNFMLEHFQIATWGRDCVIDGDLEALREPLRALADYQYETLVPGGWMQGIARLQAAARLTADANTVELAAAGVAAMARVCGQCHREQGRSLPLRDVQIETVTPREDQTPSRMFRHAWAAERMWEGLMAPSDQTWRAGALALAHAPVKAPPTTKAAPKNFAPTLAALRDLGLRASSAESTDERADLYAKTIATCAHCHERIPER